MLRALVLLLVLANLAFFAWTQGWIDDLVGVRAIGQREPERLDQQVRPEAVRILPTGPGGRVAPGAAPAPAAASAPSAAATPIAAVPADTPPADAPTCLEAGPFTTA
jgi:hypothetical protein